MVGLIDWIGHKALVPVPVSVAVPWGVVEGQLIWNLTVLRSLDPLTFNLQFSAGCFIVRWSLMWV